MTDGLHQRAEERSLALHAAIAARLAQEPHLVAGAVDRARVWANGGGPVPAAIAAAWLEVLTGPSEELHALLVDRSERARQLRQCTPFAGFLDPRTRWRVLREARAGTTR